MNTPLALAWQPYCGPAPTAAGLWSRWNLDPALLALLALAAIALTVAMARMRGVSRARAATAWGLVALLFVSPLCAATTALFAARVGHHLLLVAVAMPLLAWAWPPRRGARSRLVEWTLLQALVLWAWHAPAAYAWTFASDAAYWLMQGTLGASAWGFWRALRGAGAPAGVAALLATMVQMGLLGALLTFAPAPLYAPHLLTTAAFGITPLGDQQLGGLLMWVPASVLYAAVAAARVREALALLSRDAAA